MTTEYIDIVSLFQDIFTYYWMTGGQGTKYSQAARSVCHQVSALYRMSAAFLLLTAQI